MSETISQKNLRACLRCKLIKSMSQFRESGCDNCERELRLAEDSERILQYTTPSFQGMIAMMDPRKSWVARFQRSSTYVPGVYAIQVAGSTSVQDQYEAEDDDDDEE
eukprot:TRINITY_DN1870_c0_g1_i1.p1 TRINITY_DN1870_c0_g1~~TRINITY_DN1870_c0_g1_i1.p1  ORF type:complete len:107 (-),score=28.77 TRINITY_DN1870_c0_g1_i1:40-360(-)